MWNEDQNGMQITLDDNSMIYLASNSLDGLGNVISGTHTSSDGTLLDSNSMFFGKDATQTPNPHLDNSLDNLTQDELLTLLSNQSKDMRTGIEKIQTEFKELKSSLTKDTPPSNISSTPTTKADLTASMQKYFEFTNELKEKFGSLTPVDNPSGSRVTPAAIQNHILSKHSELYSDILAKIDNTPNIDKSDTKSNFTEIASNLKDGTSTDDKSTDDKIGELLASVNENKSETATNTQRLRA